MSMLELKRETILIYKGLDMQYEKLLGGLLVIGGVYLLHPTTGAVLAILFGLIQFIP